MKPAVKPNHIRLLFIRRVNVSCSGYAGADEVAVLRLRSDWHPRLFYPIANAIKDRAAVHM